MNFGSLARVALETRSIQGRCLGITEHQVEILNGDSGGPFDQVVEGGEDHDLASDDPQADVAKVRERRVLGRRELVDDPDKRRCARHQTASADRTGRVAERVEMYRQADYPDRGKASWRGTSYPGWSKRSLLPISNRFG